MEDKFLQPYSSGIQQSSPDFYSTDQRYMQQQYPATQMYSTYQPQHYGQSFPAYPQITDRENTFSPPPITFPTEQPNTTFQPQNNKTATKPPSFQFFNQMQSNPNYSQLQDVLAEDCLQSSPSTLTQTKDCLPSTLTQAENCLQSSLPSTLIQTVTHDNNNNGYNSVSSQQNFQIHKSHPTTQPNYRACSQNLPNPGPSLYNSQYASTSKDVFAASNHVSSGLYNQPLAQQYGPPIASSSGSTFSLTSSSSKSQSALFLTDTPDLKQKSPTISPTSSHLTFSGSSASSEQEVDSAINTDPSPSLQVDSGVDILKQASEMSGITAKDAFFSEIFSSSDHSVSSNVCPPASVLPTAFPIDHSASSNVCPPASVLPTAFPSDHSVSSNVCPPASVLPTAFPSDPSVSSNVCPPASVLPTAFPSDHSASPKVCPPASMLPTASAPVLHQFDTTQHEIAFNFINSPHLSHSDYSPITPEDIQTSNTLKRKREDETNVLNNWYQSHTQYPYPTDGQVDELVRLSGLTHKQVKKWMANKRVRCFNTLSITGNQHPIKLKTIKKDTSAFQPMASQCCDILKQWYQSNLENPYPTEEQKKELAMKSGLTTEQVRRWLANKRSRANTTKKQIPNYFIQKFPEYSQHVEMVSKSREFSRMSKRRQLDDALECLNMLEEEN